MYMYLYTRRLNHINYTVKQDVFTYRMAGNISGNHIWWIAQKFTKNVIGGFNIGSFTHNHYNSRIVLMESI